MHWAVSCTTEGRGLLSTHSKRSSGPSAGPSTVSFALDPQTRTSFELLTRTPIAEAVLWSEESAQSRDSLDHAGGWAGDPNAMLLYASLFLAGQSLTRNPEEGYKWLTLAKRFGKGDAVLQAKAKQFHDQAAPLLTPPVRERALANAAKYVPIETPRYK